MAFSWLQSLDPRPCFPAYTGPYSVGSTDVEIPVDSLPDGVVRPDPSITTVAFRIYYPCDKPETTPEPVYWISAPQREVLSGYARFCGAGSTLANFLSLFPSVLNGITIPVQRNASLAEAPTEDKRWPTMIFSHGLGGSRNAYSHICGSLASYGIVVMAPDHRDGSQPVALMRQTKAEEACRSEYRFMKHEPCQETFEGRDEQLAIRLWEVSSVLEAAHLIDADEDFEELHPEINGSYPVRAVLKAFKDRLAIHEPGSVSFAGHSFGGTTTVQLLKSAFYHPDTVSPLFRVNTEAKSSPAVLQQVTARSPCLLLDPWAMPWSSPATSALAEKPMPCFSSDTPTASDPDSFIAILSVAFYNWRSNLQGLKRILRDPRPDAIAQPHIFYPQSSAHLSQSDFAVLFPALTKHLAGDIEPTRTLELNLRGCLEVLRRAGGRWTSLAAKGPGAEDVLDEYVAALRIDDEGNCETERVSEPGDSRILAREADAVRGWVAVTFTDPADEDEEADDAVGEPAARTGDVATTTDLAGDDAHRTLGTEATLKGAGASGGERSKANKQKSIRVALRRAGSSGRIAGLRQGAAKGSQGHARRMGNAIMAAGRPS